MLLLHPTLYEIKARVSRLCFQRKNNGMWRLYPSDQFAEEHGADLIKEQGCAGVGLDPFVSIGRFALGEHG